jgi:hypothetical protein
MVAGWLVASESGGLLFTASIFWQGFEWVARAV